jgi:hypothetical protein
LLLEFACFLLFSGHITTFLLQFGQLLVQGFFLGSQVIDGSSLILDVEVQLEEYLQLCIVEAEELSVFEVLILRRLALLSWEPLSYPLLSVLLGLLCIF